MLTLIGWTLYLVAVNSVVVEIAEVLDGNPNRMQPGYEP